MILWDYLWLAGIQLAWTCVVVWRLWSSGVPRTILVISGMAYVTVPVAVLRSGLASAVYATDVLLPPILAAVFLLRKGSLKSALRRAGLPALAAATLLVPLAMTVWLVTTGRYEIEEKDWLYFYRHALYLGALGLAFTGSRTPQQAQAALRLHVVLGLGLGVLGLAHYSALWDADVYEEIRQGLFDVGETRVGQGFFGLFRGSAGHWFALLGVVSAGLLTAGRARHLLLGGMGAVVSVSILVASGSRAGMVGVLAGLGAFFLVLQRSRWIGAVMVAAVVGVILLLARVDVPDPVASRALFGPYTMSQEDAAWWIRAEGWVGSVRFFLQEPGWLLTGVGAENDAMVAEIAGNWGAHNEYLQAVYKGGILSLIGLLVFLGSAIRRLAGQLRSPERETARTAAIGLALLACDAAIAVPQSAFIGGYATHSVTLVNYLLVGVVLGGVLGRPIGRFPSKRTQEVSIAAAPRRRQARCD